MTRGLLLFGAGRNALLELALTIVWDGTTGMVSMNRPKLGIYWLTSGLTGCIRVSTEDCFFSLKMLLTFPPFYSRPPFLFGWPRCGM